MAHRRLLEETRRHLIEQGLEGVVVVLVDHHYVGVALLQVLGRADPGEAAAEHEHTRPAVSVASSGHEPKVRRPARPPVIPKG